MLKDEIEKILPKESAHYYTDQLLSLFEKHAEEIIDDWETAITYSENEDEEGNCLDKKVMDNYLKMTRAKLSSLVDKKGEK